MKRFDRNFWSCGDYKEEDGGPGPQDKHCRERRVKRLRGEVEVRGTQDDGMGNNTDHGRVARRGAGSLHCIR
ncbi:unnamed protein product [Peniophora sp. CBMAI 1063]|nr:unnamed protein product [Peniophora sp. CBMAI 1063]